MIKNLVLTLHTIENAFFLNGRIASGQTYKKNWLTFSILVLCLIIEVNPNSS